MKYVLFIIAIMSLVGCSEDIVETPEEPKMCTADYNPQCGIDGVTYGNKCMAGNTEIAYEGECTEIHICTEEEMLNKICTREYDPVCGNDDVTYATGCTACSAGVDEWTKGECEVEVHVCTDEEKQAEICTMDYTPVCGSDGETYSNGCSGCAAGIDSYTAGECTA